MQIPRIKARLGPLLVSSSVSGIVPPFTDTDEEMIGIPAMVFPSARRSVKLLYVSLRVVFDWVLVEVNEQFPAAMTEPFLRDVIEISVMFVVPNTRANSSRN